MDGASAQAIRMGRVAFNLRRAAVVRFNHQAHGLAGMLENSGVVVRLTGNEIFDSARRRQHLSPWAACMRRDPPGRKRRP